MGLDDLIDDFREGVKSVFTGLIAGIVGTTILGGVLPAVLESYPYDASAWVPVIAIVLFELVAIAFSIASLETTSIFYLLGTIFGATILLGGNILSITDIIFCLVAPVGILSYQAYKYIRSKL